MSKKSSKNGDSAVATKEITYGEVSFDQIPGRGRASKYDAMLDEAMNLGDKKAFEVVVEAEKANNVRTSIASVIRRRGLALEIRTRNCRLFIVKEEKK